MITLIYDPNFGPSTADGNVHARVTGMIEFNKTSDKEYTTSSFLIVERMRLAVKRGEITHTDVCLYFQKQGENLISIGSPDKDGGLREWPKGFCDLYDAILEELIDWNA